MFLKVMSRLSIIFFLFYLVSFVSVAQNFQPVQNKLLNYRALDYDYGFMPENLLSSRSVVVVSVPAESKNGARGEWHEFAEKAHQFFVRLGIDAVAYYYLDDILAGEAVTSAIAENFNKRKIENIVLLDKSRLPSGELIQSMIITDFNGKDSFLDHGQQAWYNQNTNFDNVLINLYRALGQHNLELSNYMVIDQPEYYKDTPVMIGRRFEEYQPDLKLDKLVVPSFEKIQLPPNIDDPVVLQTIENTNQQIAADNEKLAQIMNQYPFKYGIEDVSTKTNQQLIADGYQYVLMNIHTSGRAVKQFLNYKTSETETDYVSVRVDPNLEVELVTFPVETPVYKFYVKHLYTGDIFLGSKWDADLTWQQALENYINGMKIELKIR
jgi:hypothetical protein